MRKALVLLVALALSGCWFQPGYGPQRQNFNPFETGLTPANVASLAQSWSAPIDVSLESPPLVNGSSVVVAGTDITVSPRTFVVESLGRGSGALQWRRSFSMIDFGSIRKAVLLSAGPDEVLLGRLVSGTTAGTDFTALDPATGATTTTIHEPGLVADLDAVTVTDTAFAYVAGDSGTGTTKVVVRDRATGGVEWSSASTASAQSDALGLVVGDRLYTTAASDQGPVVHAYAMAGCGAATCAPVLTAPVPPPADPFDTVTARLLAATDAGQLLVKRQSSFEGGNIHEDLVVLNGDGTPAWTFPAFSLGGAAAAGDTVYAGAMDPAGTSALWALDAATGTVRWRSGEPTAPSAVAGGLVYGSFDDLTTNAVAVYAAAGCGDSTCPQVRTVAAGADRNTVTGITVSEGSLFVAKAGPGDRVWAFAPTAAP